MTTVARRDAATRTAILAGLGLAALVGAGWLIGVVRQNTLLESSHPREAFAAVKRVAGPRMQVRKIEIGPNEMSVLAWDPDMLQWRWVANTRRRSGFGYWYDAGEVKEQSWRVSYWTVFGHDWYRVRGPISEAVIQRDVGPTFDLRPEGFIDLADLQRRATSDPTVPKDSCPLRLAEDGRVWTICEWYGIPLSISARAFVPSKEKPLCPDLSPLQSSGSGIDVQIFSRLFGCQRVD
jgi:hypothetical protein